MPGMLSARLARAWDRLLDALALAGGIAMGAMALWTSFEVVVRYFFARPTSWAVDLAEYAMLWAAFLAAPWLLREGGHVRVEALVERLAARHQRILGIVVSLLGAAVCAVMAWRTGITTYDFYARGLLTNREWQIPEFLPYLAIPVGSALLVIEFLRRAGRYARSADGEAGLGRRTQEAGHI